MVDPNVLDRVLAALMWTRMTAVAGRRVITLDGKAVRGARSALTLAPHLVAAFDHTSGAVLGRVQARERPPDRRFRRQVRGAAARGRDHLT